MIAKIKIEFPICVQIRNFRELAYFLEMSYSACEYLDDLENLGRANIYDMDAVQILNHRN